MATAVAQKSLALRDLERALAQAWSGKTSAEPGRWTPCNPAWGQCAVTALIVQDHFGGSLLRGEVGEISHYWNVLPSGEEIDLTKRQFSGDAEIANIEPRTREYVLSHSETHRRYLLLADRVREKTQDT